MSKLAHNIDCSRRSKASVSHIECMCPCHAENEHKEGWEEEFDREFTHTGMMGERRFSNIRVNNYNRSDPISMDDQVIADLKDFIRLREAKVREEVLQEVEQLLGIFDSHNLLSVDQLRSMLARLRSQGGDTTTN
jgi:hypothetical protein